MVSAPKERAHCTRSELPTRTTTRRVRSSTRAGAIAHPANHPCKMALARRATSAAAAAAAGARLLSRQLEELMQREYQSRTMHELTAEERDTIAAMLEEEQDRRARAEADRSKLQVGAIM